MVIVPNRISSACISIPFVYGSKAIPLVNSQTDHTHSWQVFVRGISTFNLEKIIKKVTFKLHESFENSSRVIETPTDWRGLSNSVASAYVCSETGWGEFEVVIKIHFQDPFEKPLILSHFLRLYPLGLLPNEGLVADPNPVLVEKYDEFIFVEPTEAFWNTLQDASDWHMANVPDLAIVEPDLHQQLLVERSKLQSAISRLKSELNGEIKGL